MYASFERLHRPIIRSLKKISSCSYVIQILTTKSISCYFSYNACNKRLITRNLSGRGKDIFQHVMPFQWKFKILDLKIFTLSYDNAQVKKGMHFGKNLKRQENSISVMRFFNYSLPYLRSALGGVLLNQVIFCMLIITRSF